MSSRPWKTPKGTELPLLDMRGKDYLQVMHRLVWFREECPKHSIETQFVSVNETSAFALAVIKDEQGRVLSTAHKFEDKAGFPDFREKAETGAIGRALALIGYGTQFCADEFEEGERLADSPVGRPMGVFPESPPPGDGFPGESRWVFTFGQWNKKTLEQVANDPKYGPKKLSEYASYLEDNAKKTGKPLSAAAVDAIQQIDSFLAAMENEPAGQRGAR